MRLKFPLKLDWCCDNFSDPTLFMINKNNFFRSDFVYDILEPLKAMGGESGTRAKSRKKATVSSQFKV